MNELLTPTNIVFYTSLALIAFPLTSTFDNLVINRKLYHLKDTIAFSMFGTAIGLNVAAYIFTQK